MTEREDGRDARMTARTLRSLLVPVDLPVSDRVVGRAASLPVARDGKVTLLHVVPSSLPVRARRQVQRDAQAALAGAIRASKGFPDDVSVEHIVMFGSAAAKIAACAARVKADLIVMGRGAGRPLRDSFLGSTAERVVRQGRKPTLVVRLPARGRYRVPTLGLDVDDAAVAAVATLIDVVPPPLPPVTIVHAYDPPYFGLAYSGLSDDDVEDKGLPYRRRAETQLARIVARALAARAGMADDVPRFKTIVRYGSAREVIKAAAKKLGTDLLVLGTRAHAGVAHAFLGTVAGDILRDVPCDVLVVPPRGR